MTPLETAVFRYRHDPGFHSMVTVLRAMLADEAVTAEALRSALLLACHLAEQDIARHHATQESNGR